jgi:hypothetical protein
LNDEVDKDLSGFLVGINLQKPIVQNAKKGLFSPHSSKKRAILLGIIAFFAIFANVRRNQNRLIL